MSVNEYSPHNISATFSKSVNASRSSEQDTRLIPITDTVKINFNTVIWFITIHFFPTAKFGRDVGYTKKVSLLIDIVP